MNDAPVCLLISQIYDNIPFNSCRPFVCILCLIEPDQHVHPVFIKKLHMKMKISIKISFVFLIKSSPTKIYKHFRTWTTSGVSRNQEMGGIVP